ncbi:LIM domain only protein 3 [Liparis tanakae]|uniref:LIM domain only protein 3 n=1 Tax=Liparis tanakae TaxID=230148 RepID=A0A4Z2G4L7_9TELE|nr:LIM domain only protein 3 [Liparis tanakae]
MTQILLDSNAPPGIQMLSVQPDTKPKGCAGCNRKIKDRYLLKALDKYWHEDCLKCACCDCRLGEVGSTLYTKANLILCRRDYLRSERVVFLSPIVFEPSDGFKTSLPSRLVAFVPPARLFGVFVFPHMAPGARPRLPVGRRVARLQNTDAVNVISESADVDVVSPPPPRVRGRRSRHVMPPSPKFKVTELI